MRIHVALLGLVLLTGCAARQSTITNLPPGVTQAQVQNWDKAVSSLHTIATVNTNLRQSVIQLHATLDANGKRLIDGKLYIDALTAIGKIDQAENAGSVFLASVPNNWNLSIAMQVQSYTTTITSALQTLSGEGAFGANSQIGTLISNIGASVSIITSLAL